MEILLKVKGHKILILYKMSLQTKKQETLTKLCRDNKIRKKCISNIKL